VEIEHRSLANYIQYAADLFVLRAGDRVLQFASLSFDVSAEEIFATLARGATLVLRTEEMIASVEGFLAACRDLRVTVLDLPTSYWHELAAVAFAEGLRRPKQLRLVILGGEKALPERLAQWREITGAGRVRLLNGYGPSEATIAATFWEAGEESSNLSTVPIGRPVANTRAYVLDGSLEPVAIGIVGELYIGGTGLARGYRNRPDLTAEKFIKDPFRDGEERIYRTGDRVRYGLDGDLEYLGRADEQVKIRGFRVEPGEVESALRAHPAVREAAVVLRGAENQRLVAYLVANEKHAPAPADLRSFLKKTLPDFMVPSTFVTLAALPLSPSGKVDRKALPAPDGGRPELERKYVAPRDIVEVKLARLWEKVLNVESVGTQDDFFELGGHSLLAARLLWQVEKAFGRQLPLAVIFDAPTVGQLASLLREEGWSPSWRALVAIQAGGSRPPIYLVHALGGNVLSYEDLADRLGPDQPVFALQAQGLDGREPPHSRVEDMAAHYVKAIREAQPEDPYCIGGFSFGGTVAFEMARQLSAAGQKVSLVVLMDTDNLPSPPGSKDPPIVRNLRFVSRRLRFHIAASRHLEPKKWIPYFLGKASAAFWWLREKLKEHYVSLRYPLPEAIRIVNAANQEAADRYVAEPYDGRVILFRASDHRLTSLDDPSLGWGPVCRGGLEVIGLAGGHGDVIHEPGVGTMARELGARLRVLQEADGDDGQSATDNSEAFSGW
jgi:thioesterase domain-containing protein/acyl carrier protein